MASMILLGITAMVFLAVMLIILGIAAPRPADQVEARLLEYGSRQLTLEEIELAQPFSDRVVVPLVNASAQFVARFTPQRSLEATRHKLELAGNPNNWTATEFLGIRGLAGFVLAALTLSLMLLTETNVGQRLLFTAAMGVLGFFLPVLWLGSRIRRRQDEIVKTLPDVLDLLCISVEAGLPFDGAMQRVAEKWENELSKGFARLLSEMRVGKARKDALRDLADRMDVPDVTSFVAALIQADQLGISIAKVLRIQSEQMRIKRRQRAEEKAQKAPVKMLFPMTFLIFPTILIVILGPAALVLKESPVFGIM
ncbi:MAG: type II secretion system F family protein [Anaerolineae bacterium]|nr:type II secretion system F family protein [Anaerolineae bacterium]